MEKCHRYFVKLIKFRWFSLYYLKPQIYKFFICIFLISFFHVLRRFFKVNSSLWILPLHYVFVMIGFAKNFLIFCVLLQLHTIIDCNSTTSAKKKERNTIESHKLILIYVGSINIHVKLQSKVS